MNLDPQNEFAQQRILDALGPAPVHTASPPQLVASADTLIAKPIDGHHDFHYRGDSRGLITAVAASYGLTVVFDDTFPSRRVRFDLEDADFATAMQAASAVTKSFQRGAGRHGSFCLRRHSRKPPPLRSHGHALVLHPRRRPRQDLNDLMNSLRTLFEFKFVSLNAASSTITLRGPQAALEAATQFLAQLE